MHKKIIALVSEIAASDIWNLLHSTYERFDVETLGGHDLSNVLLAESSENGCLAGVVEAEDKDSCLTLLFLQNA